MRNFSSFHSVFYSSGQLSAIFIKLKNCRLQTLWVWKSLKLVVWERVKRQFLSRLLKLGTLSEKVKPLQTNPWLWLCTKQLVDWLKMKAFADDKCDWIITICYSNGRKLGEKERMLATSIFSFPCNIYKRFLFQGRNKSRFVVNSERPRRKSLFWKRLGRMSLDITLKTIQTD